MDVLILNRYYYYYYYYYYYVLDPSQYGAIPKSSTTQALKHMLHGWSKGTALPEIRDKMAVARAH